MEIVAVNLWPGLMSLDLAAQYCSMRKADFLKAVAVGDLPEPVIINGKERWRLSEIDGMFEQKSHKWQMSA